MPIIEALKQHTKRDHFDTPAYAVRPLLPYIQKNGRYGNLPAPMSQGAIAKELAVTNNVYATNFDFLVNEPSFYFDCIVTNPPYSIKDKFLECCYAYGKPLALLMPLTALECKARDKLYRQYGIDLMVFDSRIEFIGGSCQFNTAWFCYKILPEKLMFKELNKC